MARHYGLLLLAAVAAACSYTAYAEPETNAVLTQALHTSLEDIPYAFETALAQLGPAAASGRLAHRVSSEAITGTGTFNLAKTSGDSQAAKVRDVADQWLRYASHHGDCIAGEHLAAP